MVNQVEGLAKATRWQVSAEYKLKILREAEPCTQLGGAGPRCGREGLLFLEPDDLPGAAGPGASGAEPFGNQGGGAGGGADPIQCPRRAGGGPGGAP
jgi:hypothetical protein